MNHFQVTSLDFDGTPYTAKNLVDSPQRLVEGFRHLVERIRKKATPTQALMRKEVECEYLLPGRGEFILFLSEADFTKIPPSAVDGVREELEAFFKEASYFITDRNNQMKRLGHQARLKITLDRDEKLKSGEYYWGFTKYIPLPGDPMTAKAKLINSLEISIWETQLLGETLIPANSVLEIGNRRDLDVHLALDALSPKDRRTLSGMRFTIESHVDNATGECEHLLTNKGKALYIDYNTTVRPGKSHLLLDGQHIRFSLGSRPRLFLIFRTIRNWK